MARTQVNNEINGIMRQLNSKPSNDAIKSQHTLPDSFYSRVSDEQGLSLISTLWTLTILSLLATQFIYSVRLEQRAQANFTDRTKFNYAAKAGFERSIAMMRSDATPYDTFNEAWTEEIEEQINDSVQTGNVLTYRVNITDESTKININTADANMIRSLLDTVGYEEIVATEQPLAEAIVQARPYRTVRDIAKVSGMTQALLYGQQQSAMSPGQEADDEESSQSEPGLVELATIYSIDKNTDANGQQRTNIKSANAQQLTQIRGNNDQAIFTQDEAESLTQQRDSINQIGDLLDVQAVSNQTFDNIRNRLSVDSNNNNENSNNDNEDMVNINDADESQLESLDGIDQGIAQRIVAHRNNQQFANIDQLKDVKMVSIEEFRGIVDRITMTDEATVAGLININTASQEVLALLPGMDAQKAEAIITRRESTPQNAQQNPGADEIEGNPFTNIGQLLDVQDIDRETFRQMAGLVTYRSHGFRIEATGVDSRGKAIATCVGVIDRTGEQVTVKYWRQN